MPTSDPLPSFDKVQPVSFGGTDHTSATNALNALELLGNNVVGIPWGAVPLDENAKVPSIYLSDLSSIHGDTVQLNFTQVYGGQFIDNLALITNYDCNRNYQISLVYGNGSNPNDITFFSRDYIEQANLTSPGSMSGVTPGTISARIPTNVDTVTLEVNYQSFPIDVLPGYIDKPTLIERYSDVPSGEATIHFLIEGARFSFNYDTFAALSDPTFHHGYHQNFIYVDLQLSDTNSFQDIIYTVRGADNARFVRLNTNDLLNAFDTFFPPELAGTYISIFARAKYVGESLESPWSDPISCQLRVNWGV